MSRYSLKPLAHRSDVFEVAVGWDPGLCTYFAIVFGAPIASCEPEVQLWRGKMFCEISDVVELQYIVREFSELNPEVVNVLERDRRANPLSLGNPIGGALSAFHFPRPGTK